MTAPREEAEIAEIGRTFGDTRATPDLAWVAGLTGRSEPEVRTTIAGMHRYLATIAAIRAAHLAGGREFYAQICAPMELYAITRLLRPREIVELGVSSGVSSAAFLLGLQGRRSGHLRSIDLPSVQKGPVLGARESIVSVPPHRRSGWAVPRALTRRWDLRIGSSRELLGPLVDELSGIDLFLHDDLHTPAHLAFELSTIRPKLRPGAVVLADNTQWTGRSFDRFARSIGRPVLRRRGTDLVGVRVPTA